MASVLLSLALLGAALPAGVAGEPPGLTQQGAKLTGGEEDGAGRFGRSVALSADGDTALIGGPRDNGEAGAAWIYVRSGSTWTQQVKLAGAGEEGPGRFGGAVALSADGETALVGAPSDAGGLGAVWVYARSGAGWSQQAELTAGESESGKAWFGHSLAISADGDTAIVGGYVDHSDVGAAWVFVRSGSTWVSQGTKLTGGGETGAGEFGWSLALSADGETALIGGRTDADGLGAAWVFARSGSSWSQQGEKLTGAGESGAGEFGQSVALSADGESALIGGSRDDEGAGAVWSFARSGSSWSQQGEKLTGDSEVGPGFFGDAVALTPDGEEALIGGFKDDERRGAAWRFARSGSSWSQQGEKLTGGEERGAGEFGWSVALSADGETALVGGLGDAARTGAAWVFAPPAEQNQGGDNPPTGGAPGGSPSGDGSTSGDASTQTSIAGSSGTSGSAGQGVAAFKATRGSVTLLDRKLAANDRRVLVRLRCGGPARCRGRLALDMPVVAKIAGRRPARIAGGAFSIAAGRTAVVKLTLSPLGRRRLNAARKRTTTRKLPASLTVSLVASPPVAARTYSVELLLRRG